MMFYMSWFFFSTCILEPSNFIIYIYLTFFILGAFILLLRTFSSIHKSKGGKAGPLLSHLSAPALIISTWLVFHGSVRAATVSTPPPAGAKEDHKTSCPPVCNRLSMGLYQKTTLFVKLSTTIQFSHLKKVTISYVI